MHFPRRPGAPAALLVLATLMIAQLALAIGASAQSRVSQFKLANGMDIIVVPDTRAPVISQMVFYRVGSADEPIGVSGIAHFLEHLMFKATERIPAGEFSKIVARKGGQDNAFTTYDVTAYYQRIAKDRLPLVMEMEADRMVNLRLDEKEVLTERDVIIEERRSRIDNSPGAILDEKMGAALYRRHHYGIPVIGWQPEMAKLSRQDALDFYKAYYAPNNAVLVVTGDVVPEEVRALAERTFGRIPANPGLKPRQRVQEPEPAAEARVEHKDARAGRPSFQRHYLAPSYVNAKPGEAEALDMLMKIVGGGSTSRLYRALVVDKRIASSAGGYYSGGGVDGGKIVVYGVAAEGHTLDEVEAAIDAVLADVRDKGVSDADLERGKKTYIAEYVYESDNQFSLARRYGWALATGRTVAAVDAWPQAIAKVTREEVQAAARSYLERRRSVSGRLIPSTVTDPPARPAEAPAPAPKRT